MRRLATACASGLRIGGLGALLALTPPGLALVERLGLGWLFWLRGPLSPPPDVVVIGLDPTRPSGWGCRSGSAPGRAACTRA
jgi:hypothetical protein